MAKRLTGAPIAKEIYAQAREKAAALGTQPCLAAVSVGAQPDDRAYLRSIARSADGCGVTVRPVDLPPDCTADALTGTLRALSADDTVHGVLLLRPLPKALRAQHLLDALDPRKDVDGMTTASLGALLTARRLCPLHGRGVPAPAARIRLRPCGPARDRRRTQSRHRTTGGAAAHARGRDRDALPPENARPRRVLPRGGHSARRSGRTGAHHA